MNRNGLKPESLRSDLDISQPEFVTAVGEGSISRFDKPARKKRRNKKNRKNKASNEGEKSE